MLKRGLAVHVATTTRRHKGKVYQSHLLRRTYREGGKVKHQTLGNLSHLPLHIIELIRQALRGETLVSAKEAFKVERSLPHGHVAAVVGTIRKLGLDRVLAARKSPHRQMALAMIAARILAPSSKLATAQRFEQTSTLAEVLGVEGADEDDLYEAMDWLVKRQPKVEEKLAERHLEEGALVLYDVTSTYFEGRSCPLARRGYSRDHKRDRLQIVFGLMTDREGRPLAVEVFEGNTADPTTLASQVDKLHNRFGLERVVLVGDRGMITEARIREDLEPHEHLQWITSLRAPAIRKLVNQGSLQLSLFDHTDLAEITDPSYPGERLIVCLNPLLKQERTRKREELLRATEEQLAKIVEATRRPQRALKGKDRIALRVGRVLGRYKVGKHFRIDVTEDSLRFERDEDAIAAEAALDGIYVVRTNVSADQMAPEDAVQAYKNLSVAERAFRSLKTVDLKVRPIYHRLADRVRAHVFLCMLAYYVEWHMRRRLAPLLFDDEHPVAGKARRDSVVAPAKRSVSAEKKASSKLNEDGTPVSSFHTLLEILATLSKHRVRLRFADADCLDQYTTPTPIQHKALELLGVSPSL
jgi:transposase